MKDTIEYREKMAENITGIAQDKAFQESSLSWMNQSIAHKYSYNFEWMGRPIIQYPQDIIAMQELIWKVKPDLIIETGIAHGGGLLFYASMMELLGGDGQVVELEQHILPDVREALPKYPQMKRITMIEGDSISDQVAEQVYKIAQGKKRVMVALDSCHTHAHVMAELARYAPLVKQGGYVVVFDTIVNDVNQVAYVDRPWDETNNPKTAVHEFIGNNKRFEIDHAISDKLQITVCPDGFLKCVAD